MRALAQILVAAAISANLSAQPTIVKSADGRATLTFAASNVKAGTTITVVPLRAEIDPAVVHGSLYRVLPAEVLFSPPATLTIAFDAKDAPAGAGAASLMIHQLGSSHWTPQPTGERAEKGSRTARIARGGLFSVRWRAGSVQCSAADKTVWSFRLGVWDYRSPGYDPGQTTVVADPSGCALLEQYMDVKGGQSVRFFLFDTQAHVWKTTTLDPSGRSTGVTVPDARGLALVSGADREVFSHSGGKIALIGEHTNDGGKTWAVAYRASYTAIRDSTPRKP